MRTALKQATLIRIMATLTRPYEPHRAHSDDLQRITRPTLSVDTSPLTPAHRDGNSVGAASMPDGSARLMRPADSIWTRLEAIRALQSDIARDHTELERKAGLSAASDNAEEKTTVPRETTARDFDNLMSKVRSASDLGTRYLGPRAHSSVN